MFTEYLYYATNLFSYLSVMTANFRGYPLIGKQMEIPKVKKFLFTLFFLHMAGHELCVC